MLETGRSEAEKSDWKSATSGPLYWHCPEVSLDIGVEGEETLTKELPGAVKISELGRGWALKIQAILTISVS